MNQGYLDVRWCPDVLALLDANNMYVSCERVFAPRLVGRPVVVLSSNDGACIARSDEAKALGVGMAQPWFQVRHLHRSAGLIAVSANFELYSDMSARMMSVAARYAPRQQVYSIDECFLDFAGVTEDRMAIGRALRAAVLREVGLPTSIGFGPTKTLAKLANHLAKTADRKAETLPAEVVPQIAQVCDLGRLDESTRRALFSATAVGEVWGVGRKISARLQEAGIRSVLDLIEADPSQLRRSFSVVLEQTWRELNGIACHAFADVADGPADKQQILVSRSFGEPIRDLDGIIEAVSEFTSRAAEKLRQQGSAAGSVGVFFRTSPYRASDPQHQVQLTVPLVWPSDDTAELVAAAVAIVKRSFRAGFNYAKAGAFLIDLQPVSVRQGELDLFGDADGAKPGELSRDRSALMATMDELNRRFGRDSVRVGSTTLASQDSDVRRWATRQERRSPRYTTRWDEMPVVRA